MEISVNKSEITDFMKNKLAAFLVENTTDFSVAAFILQAVQNQMNLLEGKDIVVSREELKMMHDDALLMEALRIGGVDNWDWYDLSISEFVDFINENNGTKFNNFDEVSEFLFNEAY